MEEGKHSKSSFDFITGTKQSKKLQNRVTYVENGMKDLADTLLEYASKCGSIRDKMDEVAKSLATFAQYENYNTTSKLGMIASSEAISLAGDFRNTQVKKFQKKIVRTLSYENMCKNLREVLRASKNANQREAAKRRDFKKLHEKNIRLPNNSILDNAEEELEKLLAESAKLTVSAHKQMIEFEQKRCRDVKQILLSFFKHEITCLCNSLELFSDACGYITSIDEEADMQAIKSGMVLRGIQPLLDPNHLRSKERKKFTMSRNLEVKQFGESLSNNLVRAESSTKTLFSDGIFDIMCNQKQHRKSKKMGRKASGNSQGSSEITDDTKVADDDENSTDNKEDKRVSFDEILKPIRKHSLKDISYSKEKSKKRIFKADIH